MTALVKNIADHFGPRVKEHVVAEGGRPVGYGKTCAFAGNEAADEKQRKSGAGKADGESMRPNTRILRALVRTADERHERALVGSSRGAGGTELLVLRQPVFLHFRRAVLGGPAVHHRLSLEIPVRRRRRCTPFQRIRLPRITVGLFSREQTPKEI